MPVELKIPSVGESITEVEIGSWLKSLGDPVKKDEDLVTIESEKASVELPSPATGRLSKILKKEGEAAEVGDVIAHIEEGATNETEEDKAKHTEPAEPAGSQEKEPDNASSQHSQKESQGKRIPDAPSEEQTTNRSPTRVMPAARAALDEHQLKAEEIKATGPGGRLLKEDVLRHVEQDQPEAKKARQDSPRKQSETRTHSTGEEEIVPMSLLRRTIAKRLVESQHNAALLTTFNEIDMHAVVTLRKDHQEAFQSRHGIKLGFMSFFVKACVDALKQVPQLNAEIREKNIVYKNYYDIGVAIGGGKGLVVPVLRHAERLSFAEIEQSIKDFGQRAQQNQIQPDELQGGTFTISNGGVYGSLLSTPIVNPPQSGVLGLHAIQDRPVAQDGNIVIRPMMYVALTYDHRLVDGREAVTFLKRIKEAVESPARMLIEA